MGVIPLGPFDLAAPIGRGGMGEVWSGIHRDQQVPVAVKVLTSESAKKPAFHHVFRNEVRAAAALDHPGIIVVYDHGVIPPEAEAASEGRLPAGSPYLAMERANGGTLHGACGGLDWASLRLILLALLDALAHAHARGVIHRDLKPGNVLLGGLRPGPRITDFGLAHAAGREAYREGGGAGTPAYMAPEQFDGSARDHGPWTDLYALGCLAWTLVTRSPPFGRLSLSRMRAAHRSLPPPPLESPIAVAEGFEDWLHTLLEKDPGRRFRRAADAAYALQSLLSPPVASASAARELDPPSNPEITFGNEQLQESTFSWTASEIGGEPIPPAPSAPSGVGYVLLPAPPPQPADWRRPGPPSPSAQLLGAGLGLYGLRTVPMVDRDAERDLLWGVLKEARETGSARAVVLTGPTGVGKSRLAGWLAERAHEVGAADTLRAIHGPDRGVDNGLGGMIGRHLGLGGLRPAAARARVVNVLARQGVADLDEAAVLHFLADPAAEAHTPGTVRFSGPGEPHALVLRLLERMATERPLVVVLEDVQWGADAVAFAEHLLDAQAETPFPAVLLVTATTDALADRSAEQALLTRLRQHPRARTLDVQPLDEDGRAALVRELLGLEGVLAAQLEERSGGNPLFLVQLVGDWVHRGLLVPSERGFRLMAGAEVWLPDGVHEVWAARVARVVEGRPEAEVRGLEIAAVLGREVDTAEWRAVCAEAGIPAPRDLPDALIDQRLAYPLGNGLDEGWGFVHNMFRESIERLATESGRLAGFHRACANVLKRRRRHPGVAERLARHLAASGQLDAALDPMLAGARERLDFGEHAAAENLLAARERLIDALKLPETDPRRAEGWHLRCVAAMQRGELDAAEALGLHALERVGTEAGRARALLALARVAKRQGQLELARRRVDEAGTIATRLADPPLMAGCHQELAALRMAAGDREGAAELFDTALAEASAADEGLLVARCHVGLASVAKQAGRYADAVPHLAAARSLFQRAGSRDGVAECCNDLAEVDRHEGRLESAEAGYREAASRFRALGSGSAIIPQVNLGLTLLARGALVDADHEFVAALPVLERQGRLPLVAKVLVYRLQPLAAAGDWATFDTTLTRAGHLLAELGVVSPDVARAVDLAATAAETAGDSARAARARGLVAG